MPRKTHSNDSNRACRCNLSGWLQGGGCGNDFHEHQARYGQGREGRDVAAHDDQQHHQSAQHCESYRRHGSQSTLADRVKIARDARGNRHQSIDARGVAEDQLALAQQREAELGLECNEAAVRCENATQALPDAIEKEWDQPSGFHETED